MSDFASKNGEFIFDDWLFLPERLMIHLPTSIALVSDLHLAYDLARNSLGCPTKGIFPNRETMLETELQPFGGHSNDTVLPNWLVVEMFLKEGAT